MSLAVSVSASTKHGGVEVLHMWARELCSRVLAGIQEDTDFNSNVNHDDAGWHTLDAEVAEFHTEGQYQGSRISLHYLSKNNNYPMCGSR